MLVQVTILYNSLTEIRKAAACFAGNSVDFLSMSFLPDRRRLFYFHNFIRRAMMDAALKTNEVLSRRGAAQYLGICLTTLDRLDIPRTQIRKRVMYRKATLDSWLAKQEQKGRRV